MQDKSICVNTWKNCKLSEMLEIIVCLQCIKKKRTFIQLVKLKKNFKYIYIY